MLNESKESIIDLTNYEKHEKLFHNSLVKFFEITNQKTGQLYFAKNWRHLLKDFNREKMLDLYREVYINSQINHPCFLKFIGFSPINFRKRPKPIIVFEYFPNRSLELILQSARPKDNMTNDHIFLLNKSSDDNEYEQENEEEEDILDFTKKLIIIYGIAKGMSFLHSHNILHRNLNPSSIFLDDSFYPKISGLDISKELIQSSPIDEPRKDGKLKGAEDYLAPEIITSLQYGKPSDVYAFSLLMFEIMTYQVPYRDEMFFHESQEAVRPKFESEIPSSYRNLIEKCWAQDPKERPTFDEIVLELENNQKFITDEVNENEYKSYIQLIKDSQIEFKQRKKISKMDELLQTQANSFKKSNVNLDLRGPLNNENKVDIQKYKIIDDSYDIVVDKETKIKFSADRSYKEINKHLRYEIKNYARKVNILSKLNHPAIVKFVGYSPIDFNNHPEPVCIVENHLPISKFSFDDTDIPIIIYGIASAMSYLHSHNILHRNLKTNSIMIENLEKGFCLPKLYGFDISKEISSDSIKPNKTIKGAPAFIAPEIYLKQGYSKSSDVYSFGLIMYELLTGEKPHSDLNSAKEIKHKITTEHYRLTFEHPIPQCYQELIEQCTSNDPTLRPTFDAIIYKLENNSDFVIDKDRFQEYKSYIKYIQESPMSYDTNRRIHQLEDFVKFKLDSFKQYNAQINLRDIYKTETNNVLTNYDVIDVKNFIKEKLIKKEDDFYDSYKMYIIRNKSTGELNIAKKFKAFSDSRVDNGNLLQISGEINSIVNIKHPLFLRFIGYSPVDMKNKPNPFIVFEPASNGRLDALIEVGKKNKEELMFNDTKKLTLIYGIASAMAYLHSIGIIHCRLKPSNIFLDDYLFPKITGFDISKPLSSNPVYALSDIIESGTIYYDDDIHNPPELMISFIFSPAGDVYAFAVIVYELITEEIPFLDNGFFDGYRPEFNESTPECYKTLIEKCWAEDPKERPTFDEIVNHLKTNPDFLTENVDKEEFFNYVQYIEEINKKYLHNTNDGEIAEIDNYIKTQNQRFRKVKIDFKKLREKSRIHLTVSLGSSDLNKYEKNSKIGSGSFGNVYKVFDKQNGTIYAAKISIYELDDCTEDIIMNLTREIDIISALKHPSILNFVGFSPINFKGKPKPVIITEYASNGSLEKILEMERQGLGNHEWNDTKKLINIYGIAAGMLYLYYRNIIHRDLKPANVLLDEYLYPKIADFGLSKSTEEKFLDPEEEKLKSSNGSGFKGTYIYSAPEVLKNHKYSDKGDVYSYAMIVYEIMTNEAPFSGLNQFQLMGLLLKGYRPQFNYPIPFCYKNLIKKCWNEDETSRPDFRSICKILEQDPNFITPNVDKNEYLNYVEYIKETYNINDQIKLNDQSTQQIESIKNNFTKVSLGLQRVDEKEDDYTKGYDCFVNLDQFKRQEIIIKQDAFKMYKIYEKETQKIFAAQMSMIKIDQVSKEDIEQLSSDLKIILQLSHPSLLKFIGFSLNDFKNDRKPVIITELPSNRTIEDILEVEKMNKKIDGWDDTKKLINIYGIASGMSYMHSHGIIHRCLKPSNIFLDDILFPKIGDFGLSTRFYNIDNMSHQSISGQKGTPIYSAPEVLQSNEYSKSSDVYAFAFVVYEILMNEKPYCELKTMNQIFNKAVIKGERPKIKNSIPQIYRDLIEKCWSQDPNERPEFGNIVYHLKTDPEFITDKINKEDYYKYINYIDSQTMKESNQKIDENLVKVNENTKDIVGSKQEDAQLPGNFIDENSNILIKEIQENKLYSFDLEKMKIVDNYLSLNNFSELMNFINNDCNNEEASHIFDKCYFEFHDQFLNLCKEGISSHNAVAHHKYAISLIFDLKNHEYKNDQNHAYKEAQNHIKESIKGGFTLSYFSLARLYHEFYKDDKSAFFFAEEGAKKGDEYSKCLLGYFTARGIGTTKNLNDGVSIILQCKNESFISNFSTEIGIYYSQQKEGEIEAFKWFEKAFLTKQTIASINNYGICFIKGIGVDKNIEKAKEIFKVGSEKNDPNSMYHLAFLLEKTDPEKSNKYYKKSAELGDQRSQLILSILLQKENPSLSIEYFVKAASKNVEAKEFLALKYIRNHDKENVYKYITSLINKGNFRLPLNYAIILYKLKLFKPAFYYFSALSKFNHPIAMYFIGLMKYNGEGCMENKKEAYEIMKDLSEKGIDKASDFIQNNNCNANEDTF